MYLQHSEQQHGLRRMLEDLLEIPDGAQMSDVAFERAARLEVEALRDARDKLRRQNLQQRGFGVARGGRRADPAQESMASPETDLLKAVANANKVFDLLLSRKGLPVGGSAGRPEAALEQWDVLSGLMEDDKMRRLTALDEQELADVYTLLERLFRGKDGKDGGAAKADGKGSSTPPAPPCDRAQFEKFFVVRHLGLLEAYLSGGDKKEGGGDEGNITQVRWQDIHLVQKKVVTEVHTEVHMYPGGSEPVEGGSTGHAHAEEAPAGDVNEEGRQDHAPHPLPMMHDHYPPHNYPPHYPPHLLQQQQYHRPMWAPNAPAPPLYHPALYHPPYSHSP